MRSSVCEDPLVLKPTDLALQGRTIGFAFGALRRLFRFHGGVDGCLFLLGPLFKREVGNGCRPQVIEGTDVASAHPVVPVVIVAAVVAFFDLMHIGFKARDLTQDLILTCLASGFGCENGKRPCGDTAHLRLLSGCSLLPSNQHSSFWNFCLQRVCQGILEIDKANHQIIKSHATFTRDSGGRLRKWASAQSCASLAARTIASTRV